MPSKAGIKNMLPLFKAYPRLAETLPHRLLSDYPTPTGRLSKLEQTLNMDSLYVKRDDLTGSTYGGNKIRKLEFVLAQALATNRKEVLTYGFAGSNHATATAVAASALGLKSISLLMDQPNAGYLRENLLLSYASGAELHLREDWDSLQKLTRKIKLKRLVRARKIPRVIPPGASEPPGTVGFVNAAFELKEQIEKGELPEPDLIFAGLGTSGTVTGLMIGLRAAGLKSEVIPVSVVLKSFTDEKRVINHFKETVRFLKKHDSSFPGMDITEDDFKIYDEYLGEGYAIQTEKSREAIKLAESDGLILDGTYTGKVFSALIDRARRGKLKRKTVLFWNTKNSRDVSRIIEKVNYTDLPEAFHKYFEHEE